MAFTGSSVELKFDAITIAKVLVSDSNVPGFNALAILKISFPFSSTNEKYLFFKSAP